MRIHKTVDRRILIKSLDRFDQAERSETVEIIGVQYSAILEGSRNDHAMHKVAVSDEELVANLEVTVDQKDAHVALNRYSSKIGTTLREEVLFGTNLFIVRSVRCQRSEGDHDRACVRPLPSHLDPCQIGLHG